MLLQPVLAVAEFSFVDQPMNLLWLFIGAIIFGLGFSVGAWIIRRILG